jgi:hypothetical protein
VPARHDRDQALRPQGAQRVPDRRPADPELGGQTGLDQPRFGGQFVVEDALPQRAGDRLGE